MAVSPDRTRVIKAEPRTVIVHAESRVLTIKADIPPRAPVSEFH